MKHWFLSSLVSAVLFAAGTVCLAAEPDGDWVNTLKPKGTPGPELTLASDGKTDYVILLPANPTSQEEKAAEELARWLGEMTGAEFRTAREGEADLAVEKAISVGRTGLLERSSLPGADDDLGDEGYAIAVEGEDVYLFGGRKRGPIYAVFALLEEDLGCRWYTQKVNRIVKNPTLKARVVPRSYVPPFDLRDPYYCDAFNGTWSLLNRTNAYQATVSADWGGNLNYVGGWLVHTYNRMLPPGQYFGEHPEYFMLDENGQRSQKQLCMTHPEVIEIATREVLKALSANPDSELLSVSKNDIRGVCHCPRCKAMDEAAGSTSASPLFLVNKVAEAVVSEHPNVTITTLGYMDTVVPPKNMRPAPNVAIRLCTDTCMWPHPFRPAEQTESFRKALEGWSNIHNKIHIWDYSVNFGNYMDPWPSFSAIAANLRFYAMNNVTGVMIQGAYQSTGNERELMRCWVFAKLLWDPSREVWPLMQDFIRGYYGSAAPAIEEYNAMLYQSGLENKGVVDRPGFLAEAKAIFDRAEKLAENEEILHRVQLARLPVVNVELSRMEKDLMSGQQIDRDRFLALVDHFERIGRREGIRKVSERLSLDDWGDRMRKYASAPTPAELSKAAVDGGEAILYRLSADWKFARDTDDVGRKEQWFAPAFDDGAWGLCRTDLGVGWEWQGFTGDGASWYRKSVSVPDELNQRYLYFYFRAVDEEAWVYIDGKLMHENSVATTGLEPFQLWVAPFSFNAREALKASQSHRLAVRVYDSAAMGGIYLPVFLVGSDVPLTTKEITDLVKVRSPW